VEYLRQFSTDRFESQAQEEPIVLNLTPSEIKRFEEMSSKNLPRVPRTVKPWSESEWERQQKVRTWMGVCLLLCMVALAAYALVVVLRG
jgi:hypothetical protein